VVVPLANPPRPSASSHSAESDIGGMPRKMNSRTQGLKNSRTREVEKSRSREVEKNA
jgi:hypothetical protein